LFRYICDVKMQIWNIYKQFDLSLIFINLPGLYLFQLTWITYKIHVIWQMILISYSFFFADLDFMQLLVFVKTSIYFEWILATVSLGNRSRIESKNNRRYVNKFPSKINKTLFFLLSIHFKMSSPLNLRTIFGSAPTRPKSIGKWSNRLKNYIKNRNRFPID
jgi:hypothetical protein